MPDWLWFTLRYAGFSTLLAMAIGVPLAWILAARRFPGHSLLDAMASLPFALPPAVLCYYLLRPRTFSWRTALLLSIVYALPLVVEFARDGFATAGHDFENAGRSLGATEFRIFWRIAVPVAWRAIMAAAVAAFARAFADFGITVLFTRDAASTAQLLWLGGAVFAAFYGAGLLRRMRAWA